MVKSCFRISGRGHRRMIFFPYDFFSVRLNKYLNEVSGHVPTSRCCLTGNLSVLRCYPNWIPQKGNNVSLSQLVHTPVKQTIKRKHLRNGLGTDPSLQVQMSVCMWRAIHCCDWWVDWGIRVSRSRTTRTASDLSSPNVTTVQMMNSTDYFNILVFPLVATLRLLGALSPYVFLSASLCSPSISTFLILCSALPICASNPFPVCFDPVLNSCVHFCK